MTKRKKYDVGDTLLLKVNTPDGRYYEGTRHISLEKDKHDIWLKCDESEVFHFGQAIYARCVKCGDDWLGTSPPSGWSDWKRSGMLRMIIRRCEKDKRFRLKLIRILFHIDVVKDLKVIIKKRFK